MVEITDVDALAQIIRRVDGSNKLGAGALAEAILAALSPAPQDLEGEALDGLDATLRARDLIHEAAARAALRARVAELEAVAPISVRLSPEYRRGYWAGFAHGERTTLRKLLGRGHPDMIQKLPPLAETPH